LARGEPCHHQAVTPSYIKATLMELPKPAAKPRRTKTSKPKPNKKPSKKPARKTKKPPAKKASTSKPAPKVADKKSVPTPTPVEPEIDGRAAQDALTQALAQEEEFIQAQTEAQLLQSYVGLIAAAIQDNWSRPPSARNNMETLLSIQLIPNGEVVSVSVVKSSGNIAFDRSAENAVKKVQRFPELQQLATHFISINA